ncbi:MAG: DNA polymerase I [Clostridiales bacterium]|nr:DNA polymerase I [Clostridiales bacterium]
MSRKLLLLDGNSIMHRAYHALPPMDADGTPTNAVFGFLNMLLRAVRDEGAEYAAVAFDPHGPTFRHESFAEYKAGRAATPDDLRTQFTVIREILDAMEVPIVSVPGFEADDMLGTVSAIVEKAGDECVLITGDRDAFQLAGKGVTVMYTKRGTADVVHITPEYIFENYGTTPERLVDIKGLMGDNSDNIPGIPGVGEKTAIRLISQYGTLENVLEEGVVKEKGKLRERIETYADSARMSKTLATIIRNAPVDFDMEKCALATIGRGLGALKKYKLVKIAEQVAKMFPEGDSDAQDAPQVVREAREVAEISLDELAQWAKNCSGEVYLSFEDDAFYVSANGTHFRVLLGGGDLLSAGVEEADILCAIAPVWERADVTVHDIKQFYAAGALPAESAYDVKLAAYAIDPQLPGGFTLKKVTEQVDIEYDPAAPTADMAAVKQAQKTRIAEAGLESVFSEIEMPLARVLADMEKAGFLVDEGELIRLGGEYRAHIESLSEKIYEIAGERVNLNSPKQLGELLFEKMGLPASGKKTQRGYSTDAAVLENLAEKYEIARLILEYRKVYKLNSTYIEALLRLRGADGRIHTSFDQVATATGRISSLEPNLQNIPVRTEMGREIRRAFIAPEGYTLVDADYSQIELRVLAHMSGDAAMQEAFRQGADIHLSTAAAVEGVAPEEVTPQMRSAAKAVNFGIVYGISDFGLAKNLGISRQSAREFIDRYLATYPGVKAYMDACVETGKSQGYVSTLFGRRRYLPELKNANYNIRSFGERAAMNSPIQGTAADIIKLAMVRVSEALRAGGLKSRLILQVHDELIVEAPMEEAEQVRQILKQEMESVVKLSVPLCADISTGGNWNACK